VAEGTANRKIWDALLELGCDEAQGYYISPPVPADEFLPWLEQSGFGYPDCPVSRGPGHTAPTHLRHPPGARVDAGGFESAR
jgi:predicted signal transduction protein with EAL and GGDEF domain